MGRVAAGIGLIAPNIQTTAEGTVTTYTMQNGKAKRKQLSDQLDRLDRVIDALADGLNQAVTDAVKDGTRSAVREVLGELVSSPITSGLLRQATGRGDTAADANEPGVWGRVKAAAAAVFSGIRLVTGLVVRKVSAVSRAAIGKVLSTATTIQAKVQTVGRVLDVARLVRRVPAIGAVAAGVTRLYRNCTSVLNDSGAAVT
ncbi:MAG TPA: hypothetical protein VM533_09225, partial [Fimbriiglobus sp.]|nr:hypothetical protein [Fimbriiglobus sp.]